jgi:hypothetical protein
VAFLLCAGCATFEESGLPGSAASMARNQIMLVRKTPPSFGYYRLSSQVRIYPDMAYFIERHGTPDFLAETSSNDQNYFILYYLEKRRAYACRTRADQSHGIEFAGPYPITNKEHRTLEEVRAKENS